MSPVTPVLRIALFLLATWLVWKLAFEAGAALDPGPGQRLLTGVLVTLPMLGILALFLRWEPLRWRDLHMSAGAAALRSFAVGALAWLVPAALACAALAVAGLVRIEPVSGAG